ncbi:integrase [Cohnella sp. AR92]|nr:integrase [Cohnella sp. AR92]
MEKETDFSIQLARFRSFQLRRFDRERRAWILPREKSVLNALVVLFQDSEIRFSQGLQNEFPELRERSVYDDGNEITSSHRRLLFELQQRGYSRQTIRTYLSQVDRFIRYCRSLDHEPTLPFLSQYNVYLLGQNKSHAYVNQAISAILFYLRHVEGHSVSETIARPKKESKLPVVLSRNEVLRLLEAVANLKHRAILSLVYSAGLHVGEVVRLRNEDIDPERKTLHIRQSKGRKDRYTVLSDAAYEVVRSYRGSGMADDSPWLFPGQDNRGHLSERTVQKVFEQAARNAKLAKKASVHTLRHCFATHLLEGGNDIRYIQQLLGHQSMRTTQRYTHVSVKNISQIRSSLD